jgi:hypothetical protein
VNGAQLFALASHYGLWGVRGPHQEYQEEGKEPGKIEARVSILLQIDKSDLLLKFSVSAALPKNWKLHARWNSIIAEYAYSAIESTTYVICSTFNR